MFAELRKTMTAWLLLIAMICLWICSGILPFDCMAWPCLLLFILFHRQFSQLLAKNKG